MVTTSAGVMLSLANISGQVKVFVLEAGTPMRAGSRWRRSTATERRRAAWLAQPTYRRRGADAPPHLPVRRPDAGNCRPRPWCRMPAGPCRSNVLDALDAAARLCARQRRRP